MKVHTLNSPAAPARLGELTTQLGARIAAARKRRRWRAADLAARAGITRETLRRVETGALGTSLGAYVASLWALGLADEVERLAAPAQDRIGHTLVDARLGQRVRPTRMDDDF
jgi:transcriptional regulator with XRE-family HTH domain